MSYNYGKQFETKLKEDWLKQPDSTIDRIYDPVGGYYGVSNVCDFIGYVFPYIFIKIFKKFTKLYENYLKRRFSYNDFFKTKTFTIRYSH